MRINTLNFGYIGGKITTIQIHSIKLKTEG